MNLHNAHVVAYDGFWCDAHVAQYNVYLDERRHWNDEVREANHWFSLHNVQPVAAAMLLCQFNPNSESFDDAARTTNLETAPRGLVQLRQRFADLSESQPCTRSLADWMTVARRFGLKYHSWIDDLTVEASPVEQEHTVTGNQSFEMAAEELDTGKMDKGLRARLFAETDGDDAKARARYIKFRAAQIAVPNPRDSTM